MSGSFSTVSLMREEASVVERFATHYRRLGAEAVVIYRDGPVAHPAGPERSGVALVDCDADFWHRLGGRPEGLEARQHAVYRHALARAPCPWMLVVDADEYVFGDRDLGGFLASVPAEVASVRLPTAEAVWGPGDALGRPFGSTHFRLRWPRPLLWKTPRRPLYGRASRFLRQGLAGHTAGKQVLRTGRSYSLIGNHHAEQDGRCVSRWAPALPGGGCLHVGHFDAIGLERWMEKWRQRIAGETLALRMAGLRRAQMRAVAAALEQGGEAPARLFRSLYGLSPLQYRSLAAVGLAFRRDIHRDA